MPSFKFKTCRLLLGNVGNRELTIIQRRILRRLRNKTRSIKRMIYSRKNMNSYIQFQTTRKFPLFHGDLPITEMHRGTERTSYIPFPLNPETRPSVVPVRLWSSCRFEFASTSHIYLLFWKQKMLQLFPIPKMSQIVSILVHFVLCILFFKGLRYLFMDELHRAVAPFIHSSGGGLPGGSMGHGRGGGGAPFDVGLFGANENEDPADMGAAEPHQNLPRREWDESRSSREWKSVKRHFYRCDRRIDAIFEKARSMYREGSLALNIENESDIKRGLDAYFSDLHDFPSKESRRKHLNEVLKTIGKERSRIWKRIKGLIENSF